MKTRERERSAWACEEQNETTAAGGRRENENQNETDAKPNENQTDATGGLGGEGFHWNESLTGRVHGPGYGPGSTGPEPEGYADRT